MAKDNFFDGMEPFPKKHWSMRKIGDRIKGIYVCKLEIPDTKYSDGDLKTHFVLKAEGGHGHNKEGKKVEVEKDQYYLVKYRAGMKEMANIKPGQVVGYEYTHDFDMGKGNPAHCVELYPGEMVEGFKVPTFALSAGDSIPEEEKLPPVLGEDDPEVPPFTDEPKK